MRRKTRARSVLLVALMTLGLSPGEGRSQGFMYVSEWGTAGSGASELRNPSGIAASGSFVYVADAGNSRVQCYHVGQDLWIPEVQPFLRWGTFGSGAGQFNNPSGIAVSPTGDILVTDYYNYRIQVFGPSGGFVRQWGAYGAGPGQFRGPFGVAVGSNGRVYVTDQVNNRIQVFDSQGNFLSQWGGGGSGQGQFDNPCGIAIYQDFLVLVADQNNHRVQVFQMDGTFWSESALPIGSAGAARPCGIASGSEYGMQTVVTDPYNNALYALDAYGFWASGWTEATGSGPGQFLGPRGAATVGWYTLVSDRGNNRIQVFAPFVTSTNKTSWGRLKSLYR